MAEEAVEQLEIEAAEQEQAPAEPDWKREAAALREQVTHLTGRLDEATRRPATTPAPQQITPEAIEAAYAKGDITDAQRINYHAELRANAVVESKMRALRQEQSFKTAKDRLAEYMAAHPGLKDASSPLFRQVNEVLDEMDDMGHDRTDLRTQVIAVERIIGRKGTPMNTREFERRKAPVGGAGFGGGHEPVPVVKKSKGEDLWERLTPDSQAFFLSQAGGSQERAQKTLDHADEGMLFRNGRLRR